MNVRVCLTLLLSLGGVGAAELKDWRDEPLKDLNGYFPMVVSRTQEAWQQRRAELRQQVQVALGLYPLPEKSPLNPVVHGAKDLGDYVIEKVYFESFPGHYVTGSLYRPKGVTGKVPVVLCPHGHWDQGRFLDEPAKGIAKALETKAEVLECAARSPLQARCVQLARMGCVVFHYDMLGYADSVQISYELAHKFAKQSAVTLGGFYGALAEGHLQSILGLQTWNGIRALDFVLSLPEADATRVGVTGASGGGTQTFLLGAVDDRPTLLFPAVMVSTAMQGGCTCENASLLRIGTGNVELAALFAPKPLGMTAADDWTKEMATKGFPELKQLYAMLGAPEAVTLAALTQFPHNYNHPSRRAMAEWVGKHFFPGKSVPEEREFVYQTAAELTVWNEAHPKPEVGPKAERAVLEAWRKASHTKDPAVQKLGWRTIIGRNAAVAGKCEFVLNGTKEDLGEVWKIDGEILNVTHQEVVRARFFYPKQWNQKVLVWIEDSARAGTFQTVASLPKEVRKWLGDGGSVVLPMLRNQGFPVEPAVRRVANPREALSYTAGYNAAIFTQRVHDVFSVVEMVRTHPDYQSQQIVLGAAPQAEPWVIVSGYLLGDRVTGVAFAETAFRFAGVHDVFAPNFLPGALKYGDVDELVKQIRNRHTFPE
jgi:dienelactone hydrolase